MKNKISSIEEDFNNKTELKRVPVSMRFNIGRKNTSKIKKTRGISYTLKHDQKLCNPLLGNVMPINKQLISIATVKSDRHKLMMEFSFFNFVVDPFGFSWCLAFSRRISWKGKQYHNFNAVNLIGSGYHYIFWSYVRLHYKQCQSI